ncbi:MAG: ATP-binding protein [Thermoproteus sp.]
MLFLDRPAERPDELFDRQEEAERLRRALEDRAAAVVVGMRRVGKTSLIKAVTYGVPRVYLDVRAFEERGYIAYADLLDVLSGELRRLLPAFRRLAELLKSVRGVSVSGISVEFDRGKDAPRLIEILEALDKLGEETGRKVVLVLDEAQELAKLRGRTILPALAYAYDHLRHLTVVYSGSKVGLLYRFLKVEDPESPLYGRYLERIEVRPFPRELSLRYLEAGLREAGAPVDRELLEEAVDALDGVVGWLAYFGLRVLAGSKAALQETLEYAERIVVSEFCHFVKAMGSPRYVHVLKLAARGARWSDVKRYLTAVEGRAITDSETTKLLRNLVDYGFLEKRGEEYVVADPVLRRAAPDLAC